MLSISNRQAIIGNQIQSRCENHGDEKITAFSIMITHVMLEAREFNALMGDPFAHHFLFSSDLTTQMPTSRFPQLKPYALKHKFEKGVVIIKHGVSNVITFTACKINKIYMQPRDGGMCEIQFMVHTVPTLDVNAALLLSQVGHAVEVEVKADLSGEDAQQDLPLNTVGEGEEPEVASPKE